MSMKRDNSLFIPYGLKISKVYQGYIFSSNKNDIIFNFLDCGMLFTFSSFYCQNLLETRFWLYADFVDIDSKKFVFSLKKVVNSKNLKLVARGFKKYKIESNILLFNLRKFVILNSSLKSFVKSRLLMLAKRGYILNFLGLSTSIQKNKLFFRKNCSYSNWFFFNLRFIGFLNLFSLNNWGLYSPARYFLFLKQKNIKEKYYKNSKIFSFIVLGKKLNFNVKKYTKGKKKAFSFFKIRTN